MMIRAVEVWALIAAAALAAVPPRQEVSLSGRWECQLVEELGTPPAGGEWRACTVPGYLSGTNYGRAWFRRTFAVPAAMRGNRLKLRFGGVKYNSRVFVNGKHVGGCFGGYQPFELDVTDAVRFGQPNELAVGVHDWTGIFTPGKIDLGPTKEWSRTRSRPRDKILAPIGGIYSLYGVWDDVTLRALPPVHVKDLFIKTSVRRRELSVEYTLANESGQDAEITLRPIVEDKGRDALRVMQATVRIPAGKTASVTVSQRWPAPRLWSHVDPYLYHLRTELRGTGPLQKGPVPFDVLRTRFGFREFWVEGHKCYLNGSRINLLATSWWPPHSPMPREEVERRWKAVKACGCVAFRTHTQPWRPVHYDVADELGLLMIIEGAVWNDDTAYRVQDPVFWDNYAKHLKAMVARDKNRPSLIMWSLENEMTGSRMNDNTPYAKRQLARMGTLVKQWDPTRPIFYESDGDPYGVADAIGIHYPHEYPTYTCWPNEAYWLDKPWGGHGGGGFFFNDEPAFLWKKDKPLYVGEFLWLPSRDPSWHTVFFGDEAYTDYRRYRDLGKAESWRMQILGYRHYEVAGISPWTVVEGGRLDDSNVLYRAHQYAYQHIAAYCHDYDPRFYAGEAATRRVEVFNDVLDPSTLDFAWTLSLGDKVVAKGGQKLTLGPAEKQMLEVVVPMPKVAGRTAVVWRLTLDRGGKRVFDDTHNYAVFPRLRLPAVSARVGLFDPKGGTKKLLDEQGLRTVPVASLGRLPSQLDVLVVGAGAFVAGKKLAPVIGRVAPERAELQAFVARGGRVLVLEQEVYPDGLFHIGLTTQQSTMAFPQRPSHPALRGVEPGDLKFWRGDHLVAAHEPARPIAGAAMPIVVSGSRAGIDSAPLLERPIGRGCIVHCQLKLVEKFAAEPAAARILGNILSYLATYRPTAGKTALVGGSPAYRAHLRALGLRFDDLTGKLSTADLSAYALAVCRGKVEAPAKLRQFVDRGGSVLLHRTPREAFDGVRKAFGIDGVLYPLTGHVTRAEGSDPLLEAVTREDVYWLGKHVGIGWAATPRAQDMADAAFTRTLGGKQARAYEVETWRREGHIVHLRDEPPAGIVFATVGSASAEIDFPKAGTYIIGVRASGTPCRGVYPVCEVSLDGKPFGAVVAAGEQWRTYTTFGPVAKGRHTVSIAFTNDGSDPPREDRNLHVDKVLVARDDRPTGVTFLTTPPAVACVRRGKGVLVIDQLRWDTEGRNARKAARYACSLLTALGGDFASRPGVAIECEHMTPSEMPHFRNQGTFVVQACNGTIKTAIQVAAPGRYTLELVAKGTQAADVYPLVEVRIAGKKVGEVQLASSGWRPYALAVDLPKGEHELVLEFVNDFQIPGVSDRNVFYDKVLFYKE